MIRRDRHYSPEAGNGEKGSLGIKASTLVRSICGGGVDHWSPESLALAPPQRCILLTPPHSYLLHGSKLFSPDRAQLLFPGKYVGPELDFIFYIYK